MVTVWQWLLRAICAMRGHEMLRRFEPTRVWLECVACGARTPGWQIDVHPGLQRHVPVRVRMRGTRRPTRVGAPRSIAA